MSRTRNTDPFEVQRKRAPKWRLHGYPYAFGGAWRGVKIGRKMHERATRARVRDCLKTGRDPGTYQHHHSAKWDLY